MKTHCETFCEFRVSDVPHLNIFMYFIFSACACMLDDSDLAPQVTYEYDKTRFVPCAPSEVFRTKSYLIEHLLSKFVIFVDISRSNDVLPADEVRREAIHDAEAVTSAHMYMSKRLGGYQGCCDPILIFDPLIESWDPEEILTERVHSEEDNKDLEEGRLTVSDYIKRPLVPSPVHRKRRYLVPREFYESWYPSGISTDDD